jgi:hypothetical protein
MNHTKTDKKMTKLVIIGILMTLMILPFAFSTEVIVIKGGKVSQNEGKTYILTTMSNRGCTQQNTGMTLIMPELGLMKHAGRSDLTGTTKKLIELDQELESGQHLVRVVVSNDNFRKVKHTIIEITEE